MSAKIIITFAETPGGNVELTMQFEGKEIATPLETAHVMAMRGWLEKAAPEIAKACGAKHYIPLPSGNPSNS